MEKYQSYNKRNPMKRIFISLLAILFAVAVDAQSATQRLVVWQKSGEKVYFDLSEEPETTFERGQLVIKTAKTTVYYLLENVLRYTFEGEMTAINAPKLRPGETVFRQGIDQMSFDGLADGTRIEVFALDGKLLQTLTAHANETTVISLAGKPAGTYLVKVGDVTYKFLKR